jgi:HSP20 family protein
MNDLFQRFFGRELPDYEGAEGTWMPSVNISETANSVVLKAEVPGMEAKDLEVSVTGDVITLKGEKKEEKQEKGETWHRTEISSGSFTRSFKLPAAIENDKVSADYKNGILTITLPKSAASQVKEVKINVS